MGGGQVNRWRQRLDELQSTGREGFCTTTRAVQSVQNVQKPPPAPSSEHFEQSEQWKESASAAEPVSMGNWSDGEEERAAIVENDGAIPRAWAEGFARLDPDCPPGDVRAKRWLQFVNDAGGFLDSDFAAVAAALGWGPFDLFGCDRDRPFARVDRAGLLWLLNGNRLMALAENTAIIETQTGARQTYHRKPNEPGRVLAWELTKGD
jgi:hypothetical protein